MAISSKGVKGLKRNPGSWWTCRADSSFSFYESELYLFILKNTREGTNWWLRRIRTCVPVSSKPFNRYLLHICCWKNLLTIVHQYYNIWKIWKKINIWLIFTKIRNWLKILKQKCLLYLNLNRKQWTRCPGISAENDSKWWTHFKMMDKVFLYFFCCSHTFLCLINYA